MGPQDENNDGEISIEEFVRGMANLKDPEAVQQRAARVLASRSKRRIEPHAHGRAERDDAELPSPRQQPLALGQLGRTRTATSL